MFNKFPIRMGLITILSFDIPTDADTIYPINETCYTQDKCNDKQNGCDDFTHRYNPNILVGIEAQSAYLQMSA
jgi:hypothetical protein